VSAASVSPPALAAGFALGGSLIVAIGAQNAFVLRQGLRRSHVFAVAAICVAVDWTLITLGALGVGTLVSRHPVVTTVASLAGAAFLLWYGARSFRSAAHPAVLTAEDPAPGGQSGDSLRVAVATALAVSLLNPHVYLDTIVLLGSVSARYSVQARPWFALGAGIASAVWFFGLAYGARLLAPLFAKPVAWRVLDAVIGIIMWWIAASLLLGVLR
jgi:L-lysine exporter family protein LysE/ArgO